MVSEALLKLSSPVARSCLVAIGVSLLIDAALIIYSAVEYPFLIDHYHDHLYIFSSQPIAIVLTTISSISVLIAISTLFVSYYKNQTNYYVLVHAGINGIFLPALILVYFATASSRYKAQDFVKDYEHMIADYRISDSSRVDRFNEKLSSNSNEIQKQPTDAAKQSQIIQTISATQSELPRVRFESFINHIDSIQNKFSCCGIESVQDWVKLWDDYIAPSCCGDNVLVSNNTQWANMFKVEQDYKFKYCTISNAHKLGCLTSLKEDEHSKYAWLGNLVIFMIFATIANTIFSMLLYGLNQTENASNYVSNEHELSIVGVSDKPRPSQPTITSIKPRLSTVQNLETISSRAQAVRFNLNQLPSINRLSKFSDAARRGSSFI